MHVRTDRLFATLMGLQWLAGIAAAIWISPRTWIGANSQVHWHVWAAIFLGGLIASLPLFLIWKQPGKTLTRHTIAVAQMIFSGLLIHLTGGRIETHFHIFGSLALLAFYRDWRVLVSATLVTGLDHFLRGYYWPQSVFGVLAPGPWRWLEHVGWVLFEDTFLIISIRQSLKDMLGLAARQAEMEGFNAQIEQKVSERTEQLRQEMIERKRAEETVRESQALYLSLVEQLPAGVFRKDGAGRYVLANSWFCELSGASAKELLGKTPMEFQPHTKGRIEDIQLLEQGAAHHEQIMATGKAIEIEEQHWGANNEVRHMHVIKSPVFNAEGKIIGSQGILMDVTQRYRAESELNSERNLLRTLMDKSNDFIYFKDANSRFIRCSTALKKMFQVADLEELIGKGDHDFFSAEHADRALADEQEIIRSGEPMFGKVEKETWPDGRVTWALTSKWPLRDKDNVIVGTFGISKDVTAMKEAEAQLDQTHKQLVSASRSAGMAEVATSVLHNVGNVLNSVNVSSSLIADKMRNSKVANVSRSVALIRTHEKNLGEFFTNDPKGKQLPDYLTNLATHLTQEHAEVLLEIESLVSNIIHIKEIVSMQQNYAKSSGVTETHRVADLVEDAIRMNNGAMNRHNVKLTREFEDVPPILTDKHKVLQILVNLIRNAKHAVEDSVKAERNIVIRITESDGRIKISVLDNGVGILAENLTLIFNHGFTTRKNGHGFGLHSGAIAAKELGGSLVAWSDGLDCGANFILELPIVK